MSAAQQKRLESCQVVTCHCMINESVGLQTIWSCLLTKFNIADRIIISDASTPICSLITDQTACHFSLYRQKLDFFSFHFYKKWSFITLSISMQWKHLYLTWGKVKCIMFKQTFVFCNTSTKCIPIKHQRLFLTTTFCTTSDFLKPSSTW